MREPETMGIGESTSYAFFIVQPFKRERVYPFGEDGNLSGMKTKRQRIGLGTYLTACMVVLLCAACGYVFIGEAGQSWYERTFGMVDS